MALIPEDPKQRNALILGILAIGLFYVFWAYWYSPRQVDIEANAAQLERLDQNNRLAQIIVARGGEELEERLTEYEQHVDRLEGLIPQDEEVAALLNQISAAARQTGVSDPGMQPEPDEVGAFYTKESYEISVIGEYHDIGRFLTRIASLPRIITPVDLEIIPYTGDASLLDPDLETPLSARLRIQTYILPQESVPPVVEGSSGEGV